ncbi:MAG: dTDP-4-dehydrorhamnose reductase [Candidatus Kuenenia sp.]|nr:dTDP-4-dehydrorhamnose reductase [Candidatus Kuenenia hertensis]
MKILIIGSDGMLGRELANQLPLLARREKQNFTVITAPHTQIEITNASNTSEIITRHMPDVIINGAAFTDVDACETNTDKAYSVNADGAKNVAQAGKNINAKVIHISTDYVFDGMKNTPYIETDQTHPLSVYGKSKLAGESAVQEINGNYAIVRISRLYGVHRSNFVTKILALGAEKRSVSVVTDQFGSPTYAADIVPAIWYIFSLDLRGIYHIANDGFCSWYEWAKKIFELTNNQVSLHPIKAKDFERAAAVPQNSSLDCTKFVQMSGYKMRPWQEALEEYLKNYVIH